MFRVKPQLPAWAMKAYVIAAPLATHWVPATCRDIDCPDWVNGWRLRKEGLSQADLHTATHCGRRYREVSVTEGETWLVFEAGQPCFQASTHRRRVEREERFIIRDGDHRGNPRGTRPAVVGAGSWVDDFGEHQERLADAAGAG